MQKVVIGGKVAMDREVQHWMNFVVDFDIGKLSTLSLLNEGKNLKCQLFEDGRLSRFSPDGTRLATIKQETQGGKQYDLIELYEVKPCGIGNKLMFFPALDSVIQGSDGPQTEIEGYNDAGMVNPYLPSLVKDLFPLVRWFFMIATPERRGLLIRLVNAVINISVSVQMGHMCFLRTSTAMRRP
jgi:hypothetical protein